jgi:hypothetical protein
MNAIPLGQETRSFHYTNWRGVHGVRRLRLISLRYGTEEPYHPVPGWLMLAEDVDREPGTGPRWFGLATLHPVDANTPEAAP